jgi:hypothetical protein
LKQQFGTLASFNSDRNALWACWKR